MSTATTSFTLRMDTNLKHQFDDIADKLGLSTTAALNVMAKKFVTERGFPFSVRLDDPIPNATTAKAMEYARSRADGTVNDDSPSFTNGSDAIAYLEDEAARVSN
ncbi:type II toxin-antitoxin system RelB/DinJ family antitoxin [Bifidobacterium sp. ESL0790]|uniref:type II toxin-antitoxin system RelB/DinJ family antitoxin n=1 Tax=Bifidobacterium sp. ESL0790 TaxID=2983233 RepID=UPI0023F62B28|nr:type II toxin-antitoxin system RelB/DinJ family antitoxin [Bifidobacterium sp. ESL0790]WEV72462.1 type II toxin-antitoxin system RelB/DinJ family antitoxin [Bifidobacterium sp. ESL0790]